MPSDHFMSSQMICLLIISCMLYIHYLSIISLLKRFLSHTLSQPCFISICFLQFTLTIMIVSIISLHSCFTSIMLPFHNTISLSCFPHLASASIMFYHTLSWLLYSSLLLMLVSIVSFGFFQSLFAFLMLCIDHACFNYLVQSCLPKLCFVSIISYLIHALLQSCSISIILYP